MPNSRNIPLQSRARPVLLTGYDVEIDCPQCNTRQIVGDDPDGSMAAVSGGEHISLHALPGRYILLWRLTCWNCGNAFSGSLKISSRSAGHSPERRRGWGG